MSWHNGTITVTVAIATFFNTGGGEFKDYEKQCRQAIEKYFPRLWIAGEGTGSCIKIGGYMFCPDIYGTYQVEEGSHRKGFVIDCKHYTAKGRNIDQADCDKLKRDICVVKQHLIAKRKIGPIEGRVVGMFVTTEGSGGVAESKGFHVIYTAADPESIDWHKELRREVKDALREL